jgi:RNA:NAD 2'-phosphotransferase (TPT1/KptA family)
MDSCGWVDIDDLISLSPITKNTYQENLKYIQDEVKKDKKGRFEIIRNKIRATNGHSVLLEKPIMTPITQNKFAWVVHLTTESSWEKIQKCGFLQKMSRDYIHFAIKIAHLRNTPQHNVYLYLHTEQLLQDGYKLFITTNSVIGSFEDIPIRYLSVGSRP